MPRSYVDNAYNRSVGRVGMPVGSCVISRSSGGGGGGYSGSSSSHSTGGGGGGGYYGGSSSTGGGDGYYGGSSSQSAGGGDSDSYSGSSGTKTYVDNAYNRRSGRVGLPVGSMVISKNSSSEWRDYSRDSGIGASPKTQISSPGQSSFSYSGSSSKTYVDNSYNRSLGHVGMPHGSMVVSKSGSSVAKSTGSPTARTYVDNSFNRSLGRVGMPLGSCRVSHRSQQTQDRQSLIEKLQRNKYDDLEALTAEYGKDRVELQEALNHINRMMEELRWKEESNRKEKPRTSKSALKDFTGQKIQFEEIELRRKIGQGGFGDVFFAKWKGTAVAVKKLRVQRVSKRRLQEFTDEVLNFCELNHPNIVQFLGACVVTPNLAIVMEYMQMSLFDALFMDQNIDFSEEQRLSILHQTVRGLWYLHDKKTAHCDLKSSNVLLNVGETVTAKITDFGLSMIKSDSETSQSTAEELVRNIGTPRYSAPEVLRGLLLSRRGMMRTDIYSLSLIIYEVLFEEEPFYNFSYAQLRKQVGEMGRTPEIPDNVKVDKRLNKMIQWCWDFDPYKRPDVEDVYDFFKQVSSIYRE